MRVADCHKSQHCSQSVASPAPPEVAIARLMREGRILFYLLSAYCATWRERGPWRLGESRQGKPSREWEGTQLGNLVFE
jgi:hypothetical protein